MIRKGLEQSVRAGRDWLRWSPSRTPFPSDSGVPASAQHSQQHFQLADGGSSSVLGWSDRRCAEVLRAEGLRHQRALKSKESLSRERLAVGALRGALQRLQTRSCVVGPLAYEAALEIVAWTGNIRLCLSMRDEMRERGIRCTSNAYAHLVNAASRARTQDAQGHLAGLLKEMKEEGLFEGGKGGGGGGGGVEEEDGGGKAPHGLFLALLRFYTRQRCPDKVDAIVAEMRGRGMRVGAADWACVIESRMTYAAAVAALAEMRARGVRAHDRHFRGVFLAAKKGGDVQDAKRFMSALRNGSWPALVAAVGSGDVGGDVSGEATTAAGAILVRIERMTYNAYLGVFSSRGLLTEVRAALRLMQDEGHECDHITFSLTVEAYAASARRGRLKGVKEGVDMTLQQAWGAQYVSCRRLYVAAMAAYAELGDVAAATELRSAALSFGVPETELYLDLYARVYQQAGVAPPDSETLEKKHLAPQRSSPRFAFQGR